MGPSAIALRGVDYCYPDGLRALKGVDLEIERGERVGLIGPNGAGKTTLLLHLGGLLTGRGSIEIGGLPLNRRTLSRIRKQVGLVFQDPDDQLFMPTVFDDVAFGPLNLELDEDDVRARVREALRRVGLEESAKRPPHHLSFGEKKRVALATVLAMRPEILALDEPTSNMDPRARREFCRLLGGVERERTVIVATHDLELVRELCPRAVLLDRGGIVADAPTDEVLTDERLMEEHGLEVPRSLKLAGTCRS